MRVRGGRGERGGGCGRGGTLDGIFDGTLDGIFDGIFDGTLVGTFDGTLDGTLDVGVHATGGGDARAWRDDDASTRVYALARGDASHRRRDVDTVRRHTRVSTLRRSRAEDASRARRERARSSGLATCRARSVWRSPWCPRCRGWRFRSKDSRRRSPREPPRSRRFACETSRAAGRTAARERVPPRTAFACVFRRAASPFPPACRRRGRNRRRVGGEKRVGGKKPVGREKRVGVRPVEERVAERLADVTVVRRTDRDDVRTSCVVASPRGRGGDDGAVDSPDRDGRGGRSRGGVLRTAAARAAPAEIPNSSVCRGNDRDAVDGGVRDRRERRDAPRGARRSRVGGERDVGIRGAEVVVRDSIRRARSRGGTDRARHSRRWARPRRRRGSSRPVDDGTPFFSRRPRRRSKTRRSTRTPRTSFRRRFESAPRRNPNRHPGLARRWFGCTARPRPNGSEAEAPPIRERRARTPRTRTDARTCSTGSTSSWSGRRFCPSGPIASARSARTISAPSPIPSPRTDPTGGIADHSTPRRRSGTFVGPSRDRRRRRSRLREGERDGRSARRRSRDASRA